MSPLLERDTPQTHRVLDRLVEAGVIKDAKKRAQKRRRRIAAVGVALAAIAGVVAAAVGGASRDHPLRLPPERVPTIAELLKGHKVAVFLSPNLGGGSAKWCVSVIQYSMESGTCGQLPTRAYPVLPAGTGWGSGEADDTTVVVTAPSVSEVYFQHGLHAAALRMPGLPFGMRAAVLKTPHDKSGHVLFGVDTKPVAVRMDGRVIHYAAIHQHHMWFRNSLRTEGRVLSLDPELDRGDGVWFRDWKGAHAPDQPCKLHVSPGIKATVESGQTATAIRAYPAMIVGRGFFSCVDVSYYTPGRGMTGALLLDAAVPVRGRPAMIPGLEPISGLQGYFNSGTFGGVGGRMTARRDGNAWLVVAGGGHGAERARIRLLQHLTATIGRT